jgi:hypothetical protein
MLGQMGRGDAVAMIYLQLLYHVASCLHNKYYWVPDPRLWDREGSVGTISSDSRQPSYDVFPEITLIRRQGNFRHIVMKTAISNYREPTLPPSFRAPYFPPIAAHFGPG